jgi:predicted alpha/beta-fold hydrolase
MCIDVAKKTSLSKFSSKDSKEKCVILMHGVTGNSTDEYIKELAGHCTSKGYNVIAVGHYAPEGE